MILWVSVCPAGCGGAEGTTEKRRPDVVYVGSPRDVVAKMLDTVKVTKDDVLYDLGCGDGRIVVAAAKKYGCRAIGYDINPVRIREALENAKRNGVEDLVKIERKDIFTVDISEASVVALYLLPSMNVKLIPQLEKLKPGSRIVAHDYAIEGYPAEKTITMTSKEDAVEHYIYLWTAPLKKAEDEGEEEDAEDEGEGEDE
jgi:cyclopropane fatty-acyl-phospholipid synthase-like methyltransferase